MTFEASMSQLGRDLSLLLMEPAPMPPADVQPALAARESTMQLLDILALGNALGRRESTRDASEMVRNPTGTLNRIREQLGRVPADDAHGLLSAESTVRSTQLWLSVHRHATVAKHEWGAASPDSRPQGGHAWSLAADGAALTGAISIVDRHLATALKAAGRVDDGERLQETATSGLRLAAAQVAALARNGDLEDPPPLVKAGLPKPVAVRSRAGQREGYRRLQRLVDGVDSMHPVQLRAVLVEHAQTLAAASRLVTGDPLLATAMMDCAHDTHRTAQALNRVQSLEPRDSRPVVQAHQLRLFVTAELRSGRNPDVGMAVARAMARTSAAVANCAERQVRAGRWLVGDGGNPSRPLWVQADLGDHRPDALRHAQAAAHTASKTRGLTAPDPMPGYAPDARLRPPRESLGGLVQGQEPVDRPSTPAHRLAPPRTNHQAVGLD